VIETSQILAKTGELAAWAGVPRETLRTERGWLFSTATKHHMLATLDRSYVQDTANRVWPIDGPLLPGSVVVGRCRLVTVPDRLRVS
jgi:hypothetical protein